MDINIALNTIVYISIFLFPGILFRKFLFIGVDNKQFYIGHLFERFLWTVFFSFITLLVSYFIFRFSKNFFSLDDAISYETIKGAFTTLSKNEFPAEDQFDKKYKNLVVLLIAIYLLSAALGYFSRAIFSLGIIKNTGIFKRFNYWEDLIKGFKHDKTRNKSDLLTYGYTKADILIKLTDSETKLYSGVVKDYFICSQTNKLQEIVLEKTNRYSERKQTSIPGDNFIIPGANILNLNFTYIFQKKDENKLYSQIQTVIDICFAISIIGIIVYLFASDGLTPSIFKKIVFFFASLGVITQLKEGLKHLITGQLSKFRIEHIYPIVFNSVPLVWIFGHISGTTLIFIEIGLLIVIAIIMTVMKKKKEKDQD